ncbi:MAG TPA: DUF4124 domain-containing protein [Burkholderiaceae bacterium]|nr:DUF4124 domain-containing protein [Burkholderiaceae bacterium]
MTPTARAGGCVLVAALLFSPVVTAQQVVRCEGEDGRVTYGNAACPPGTRSVRTIEPPKAPTEGDRDAARSRAEQNAKSLERIQRERQQAQKKAERERSVAANKANDKARECAKLERALANARKDLEAAPLAKREAADRKLRDAQSVLDGKCSVSTDVAGAKGAAP